MVEPHAPRSWLHGVSYPESPRWQQERLWISDVHDFSLKAFDGAGIQIGHIAVPGRPAGTGFCETTMIVATALDRKVSRIRNGMLEEIVDLSGMTTGLLNDMVVDRLGRAYVGDTGFRFGTSDPQAPGRLFLIERDGQARIVAEDLIFPNGVVITADGETLLVAETFAYRISAFTILPDGALANRRIHALIPGTPDGICLDADGGLWIALLSGRAFIRIDWEGRETHRYPCGDDNAIACMIGGADQSTLFLCHAQVEPVRRGSVSTVRAPFRAAGLP